MRSEERLKVSYGKQKDVFESAKKKKISNLEDRKRQLEEKIEHLNYELETTKRLIQEEAEREFCSFRDFQERATLQSQQTRAKIVSKSSSQTNFFGTT